MSKDFPRLLVATEFPPNASGGGGAIVRQMLKGWPVEKLFWWSCLPDPDKRFGQQVAEHRVAAIPKKWYPLRRLIRQKAWVMENFWVPRAARHLRETLASVQPDVVWTIPHAWAIPPLARVLPELDIGYHVSVHDYPDIKPQIEGLGIRRCQTWLKGMETIYASARTRDAICQPMVDDLFQRTGQSGKVIRAGLEDEDFERLQMPEADSANQIRIAYAGTIHVPEVFARFVAVLDKIRRQLPRPVTIDLFGSHAFHTLPWFDKTWMNDHGNLPVQLLNGELRKCTWGFSPMAMADEDPSYNQFSFPTKFVSYLATGLPIISLGQPESSVQKMAASYQTGICLTTLEEAKLGEQLLKAFSEPDPKTKYHAGLWRCANTEFDVRRMRATLYADLEKSASVTTTPGLN